MTGRKRSTDDTQRSTRASKAAKLDTTGSPAKPGRGGKKASTTAPAASAFKSRALPLHANITHAPPSIDKDVTPQVQDLDVGAIGTVVLTPTTFSTGSYGWKGNKRIIVELQASETEEKEKVSVMLSINATVVGSKHAKEGDETQGGLPNEDEPKAEEAKEAGQDVVADSGDAKLNGE